MLITRYRKRQDREPQRADTAKNESTRRIKDGPDYAQISMHLREQRFPLGNGRAQRHSARCIFTEKSSHSNENLIRSLCSF